MIGFRNGGIKGNKSLGLGEISKLIVYYVTIKLIVDYLLVNLTC